MTPDTAYEMPGPDEMADLLDARGYPTIATTLRVLAAKEQEYARYEQGAVAAALAYSDEITRLRAVLRERDAAHEIALKKARADALNAAAALFDKKDAEARAEIYYVTQPHGGVREEHPNGFYMSAREAAGAIRALLEEAGK